MSDDANDLKALLLEVLTTVRDIKSAHEKRFDAIEQRLDHMSGRQDQMAEWQGQITGQLDQVRGDLRGMAGLLTQSVSEQKQIEEMVGNIRLKEIGRLDGRIDQLSMDVALSRRGAA